MLEITGGSDRGGDGLRRRAFFRVGVLGLTGLTLADWLRGRAFARSSTPDTSVILIWKGGGPSHIDLWDLKPEAPAEYRGEFKPIATNVAGIQIGEHLPLSARQMDKFTILRSVTHPDAGHESASHYLLTGYRPTNDIPAQEMPSYGSITARVRGARRPGLPPYVAVPNPPRSSSAGYLGVAYNPFAVGGDPNGDKFSVRNLTLPSGMSLGRLEARRQVLASIDTFRRASDQSGLMQGLDDFTRTAFEMVTGPAARQAFALNEESAATRELYGRHTMGQSFLLARRLVEAGVTFVTIDAGGWDTHANNFENLKTKKLPPFDRAWAALVQDLHQRGLAETTLVLVWGEFGRTPLINKGAGRDHWPSAQSVVVAGGGMRMGQAIGSTDAKAEKPRDRPISPEDVLATLYHHVGVDINQEFYNEAQRPLRILNGGTPIPELLNG